MKADRLRAQITVGAVPKTLALIIAMLTPFGFNEIERILKTVCHYFGFKCERA